MSAPPSIRVRKAASKSADPQTAANELFEAIHQPDAALILFYCAPNYDLDALGRAIAARFGAAPVIGCTTAGEITPIGYLEGSLTGVSIAGAVRVSSVRIDDLMHFEFARGDRAAHTALQGLQGATRPSGSDTFGLLITDGLAMQEEALVASIYRNLGDIQLIGGSAGDGTAFERTYVFHEGRFRTDCAVFMLVQTDAPFTVFKTQHFVPSTEKMVVTKADPARRLVTEINGEPAGREYARVVGLALEKLTPFVFASHPVVVRVGGVTYLRSIQKVNDDESLTFFCAIDNGIVLTVGKPVDLVDNLAEAFANVRRQIGAPALILGCDCILRRLEIVQSGFGDEVGALMADNNVIGFATYGEQYNGMHVNQTFTGVAIGARESRRTHDTGTQ